MQRRGGARSKGGGGYDASRPATQRRGGGDLKEPTGRATSRSTPTRRRHMNSLAALPLFQLCFVVYYPAATEGAATAATDRTEGLLSHLFLGGFPAGVGGSPRMSER